MFPWQAFNMGSNHGTPKPTAGYNCRMQYNVKGTNVQITPELRVYLESRLTRHADKFLKSGASARADVELEHAPLRDGGTYRCEFNVSASGALHRADAWGSTLHEAIDLAADELARELRRTKKRRLHSLRRGAMRIKEYLRGWRDRP